MKKNNNIPTEDQALLTTAKDYTGAINEISLGSGGAGNSDQLDVVNTVTKYDGAKLTPFISGINDEQIVQNDEIIAVSTKADNILQYIQNLPTTSSITASNNAGATLTTSFQQLLGNISDLVAIDPDFTITTGSIHVNRSGAIIVKVSANVDAASGQDRLLTLELRDGATVLSTAIVSIAQALTQITATMSTSMPINATLPKTLTVWANDSLGTTVYTNVRYEMLITGANKAEASGSTSSDISNLSTVSGTNVTEALDSLNTVKVNDSTYQADKTTQNTRDDGQDTLIASKVDMSSTQTISGKKTFTLAPTVPLPTIDAEAASKLYVDGAIAAIPEPSGGVGNAVSLPITYKGGATEYLVGQNYVIKQQVGNLLCFYINVVVTAPAAGMPNGAALWSTTENFIFDDKFFLLRGFHPAENAKDAQVKYVTNGVNLHNSSMQAYSILEMNKTFVWLA